MNLPRKYVAVGAALAFAGGSAIIGEVSGNGYRDDLNDCIERVDTDFAQAAKDCTETLGNDPRIGYQNIALLGLAGAGLLALIMKSESDSRKSEQDENA